MAVVLAAGTMGLVTARLGSARSGPNPVERRVLPVTSGASAAPQPHHTGKHGTRRSDGAAPTGREAIAASESPRVGRITPGAGTAGAPGTGASGDALQVAYMLDPSTGTATVPSTSLRHQDVMAVPVPLPDGAVELDSTYYDLQDMGSLGHRIEVGADGRIHAAWEDDNCNVAGSCPPNLDAPQPYPYRAMSYAYRDVSGIWHDLGRVGDPTIACPQCAPQYLGGFGTLSITRAGHAVVAQHMQEDGCDERGDIYVQNMAGAASWMAYLTPIVSPSYLFPQAVALENGSMVLLGEIPLTPPNHFYEGTADFRISRIAAEGQRFTCPTGWQMGPWTQVVPATVFRDGHGAFPCLAAASDGRVGVAVTEFGGNVFLIESTDGTFAPSTITLRTLTAYTDAAITKPDSTSQEWRPYIHCHLAYQDTTPHVVWSELQARRIGSSVEYFDWRSRIRHWSSTQGLSTVKQVQAGEADSYDNIDLGLHGPLAGFNTISVDWPQVGFSTDGTETYVVWLRFTDDEVDPTAVASGLEGIQTGTGYGDIACSVMRAGGWSAPQNLTQTPRTDERYVSIATRNDGGKVHIVFQASATDQAGIAVIGDRGGTSCGPSGCRPLNLVRRIAYLEQRVAASLVGIADGPGANAPAEPPVLACRPNPATDAVQFTIDPARAGHGGPAVLVFSITGRRVARLPMSGGRAAWNGRDASGRRVPSGLYLSRLEGDRNAPGTKFMIIH